MPTTSATRTTVWIFRVAAFFTAWAVVMGSAVCATESGMACPTWPGCYAGQVTPTEIHSRIEIFHRFIAFISLLTMLAAAIAGRRLADRRLRILPWVGLIAAIASAVFGMMIVLFSLPKMLGILDVAAAMVALCLNSATAVWVTDETPGPAFTATRMSRTGWVTALVILLMHLLGIVVSTEGSFVRCLGWPVWRIVAADHSPALQVVRIVIGVLAVALVAWLVVEAWRRPALRLHGVILAVLLAAELVLGQLIVGQFTGAQERHIGYAGAYSVLAGLILWCVALLAARARRLP